MAEERTSEKDSRGSHNENYEESVDSNGCFRVFCVRKEEVRFVFERGSWICKATN